MRATCPARTTPPPPPSTDQYTSTPHSLDELLRLPLDHIPRVDLGRMNLLCAQGLPGAEELDTEQYVHRLDAWSERIRRATDRHLHYFRANPDKFQNSEPIWRLIAMARLLRDECRVSYHMERIHTAPDWTDSQDLLIHGLLGPRRTGTCASLPVLVAAIGRRLGYPISLSIAPAHLFSRWDGREHANPAWRERFNIEFSGELGVWDDEHYYDFPIRWPQWMRDQHRRGDPNCEYLYSLNPAQELAHSLCLRAVCLEATGEHVEAVNTYYLCRRYDNRYGGYLDFANRTLRLRAERVMESLGFVPLIFRAWLLQSDIVNAGWLMSFRPDLTPLASLVGASSLAASPPRQPLAAQPALDAPLPRSGPYGVPPTNLADLARLILNRTCAGTPARPSIGLLFPHPPEPKVDPYAAQRDENGRIHFG